MNTKRNGIVRTIIFKSGKLYKAVCLDFDIIEEAKTRDEVEVQIREAIAGYLENVCKNNLNDKLLNRRAEKKYWDMFEKYQKLTSKKDVLDIKNNIINKTQIFTLPISQMMQTSHC